MNAVALDGIKDLEPSARERFLKDAITHLKAEADEIGRTLPIYSDITPFKEDMERWQQALLENAACFEAALVGDELTGNDLLFNFFSLSPMAQLRLKEVLQNSLRPCYDYNNQLDSKFSDAAWNLSSEINIKCRR
ncbi:MAG: hypothetical protein M0R32_08385 [Candidatus Cloacimonetes bacterium]|jgi:hypothetical protein|nr:hypothetical protein [Candidatus Cloacimonadota bacterium]